MVVTWDFIEHRESSDLTLELVSLLMTSPAPVLTSPGGGGRGGGSSSLKAESLLYLLNLKSSDLRSRVEAAEEHSDQTCSKHVKNRYHHKQYKLKNILKFKDSVQKKCVRSYVVWDG